MHVAIFLVETYQIWLLVTCVGRWLPCPTRRAVSGGGSRRSLLLSRAVDLLEFPTRQTRRHLPIRVFAVDFSPIFLLLASAIVRDSLSRWCSA